MKNITKITLLSFMLAFFSFEAKSQTCQAAPDCASLGFKLTASDCGSYEKMKCPFGEAYFCNYCEINGYTSSSCAAGQQSLATTKCSKVKCTGTACELGYTTGILPLAPGECIKTQASNSSCRKSIAAGNCSGMSRTQAMTDCPVGHKVGCADTCGNSKYVCCTGGTDCFMLNQDGMCSGGTSWIDGCCRYSSGGYCVESSIL